MALSIGRHARCLALLAVGVMGVAAEARAARDACIEAIAVTERTQSVPPGLLRAIALVESGRRVADGGFVPWPWTINSPAGAFYLASRAEAVAKVEALRGQGIRNIDVGCMQVNLFHHPDAFPSLAAAFDPAQNVAYAARFLGALQGTAPSLFDAVGRYHSHTPSRARPYAERVFARWGRTAPLDLDEETVAGAPQFYRRAGDGWLVRTGDGSWQPLAAVGGRPRALGTGALDGWLAGRPRRTR